MTRVENCAAQIEREGFILHPIAWQRGSINPLRAMSTVKAVRGLYRSIRPDIAHYVALVSAVVGSIAAMGLVINKLNALAGLGFIFTSSTIKERILRPFRQRRSD